MTQSVAVGKKYDTGKPTFRLLLEDHGGTLAAILADMPKFSHEEASRPLSAKVWAEWFNPAMERDLVSLATETAQRLIAYGEGWPWVGLPLADVVGYGARKYAARNWRLVPDGAQRYAEAVYRHSYAWVFENEEKDKESGYPHWTHILWNCLALLYFLRGTDPRVVYPDPVPAV